MARFARDCLAKFHEVTRMLEVCRVSQVNRRRVMSCTLTLVYSSGYLGTRHWRSRTQMWHALVSTVQRAHHGVFSCHL
jgi:hypothetical protein